MRPRAVLKRTWVPSKSTHTGVDCGEPVGGDGGQVGKGLLLEEIPVVGGNAGHDKFSLSSPRLPGVSRSFGGGASSSAARASAIVRRASSMRTTHCWTSTRSLAERIGQPLPRPRPPSRRRSPGSATAPAGAGAGRRRAGRRPAAWPPPPSAPPRSRRRSAPPGARRSRSARPCPGTAAGRRGPGHSPRRRRRRRRRRADREVDPGEAPPDSAIRATAETARHRGRDWARRSSSGASLATAQPSTRVGSPRISARASSWARPAGTRKADRKASTADDRSRHEHTVQGRPDGQARLEPLRHHRPHHARDRSCRRSCGRTG